MAKIIDLNRNRAMRKLSPVAQVLSELVSACRELLARRPNDPALTKIRVCIEDVDKEMDRD